MGRAIERERGAAARPVGLRGFRAVCWLPLAAWGIAEVYVSRFDGWGAWAAAPVLLLPIGLSLLLAIAGGLACWREAQVGGSVTTATALATALAAAPLAWFAVRAALVA